MLEDLCLRKQAKHKESACLIDQAKFKAELTG